MRKTLALLLCLSLIGCAASISETALCRETDVDRTALNAGIVANPDIPEAVGNPAVGLLVTLSVCEGR